MLFLFKLTDVLTRVPGMGQGRGAGWGGTSTQPCWLPLRGGVAWVSGAGWVRGPEVTPCFLPAGGPCAPPPWDGKEHPFFPQSAQGWRAGAGCSDHTHCPLRREAPLSSGLSALVHRGQHRDRPFRGASWGRWRGGGVWIVQFPWVGAVSPDGNSSE